MACWNFITAYAVSSEFLASQDWLGMNSEMRSSFINTMESVSPEAFFDEANLIYYENETPRSSTMTFSREADNLEIGWRSSSNPSIKFFVGICLSADAEELVYSWRYDHSQIDHQLAFSHNTFIRIR